ncbi:urease accessory protein [Terrimicrobium sacchariphilum]|uniref:Urease accessory protein UreF n=1 Tax=Terrimicrobium sacchariphilum TaxID=690879 RepID=A0A146G1S6_TERSA|nr:urease accessory UreF family protein [Terrimicrobium sacchariphilum]GAT31819.1 urease accessory protein [Terrimicrobium sacchariphilum]
MIELEQAGLAFLLQTSDATFPTGSYAHSLGMEEMVQQGRVHDEVTLRGFLSDHVIPAAAHIDLPLVAEAHRAVERDDIEDLLAVDHLSGALRPARELRAASLQTGRRRLAMLAAVSSVPIIRAYQDRAAGDAAIGHHASVWGAACSGLPVKAALTAYLYQSLAGYCAAAPKLIRIGQEGIQRVLTAALGGAMPAVDQALSVARAEIGWFDPVVDIASMWHEISDERLFIS